MHLRKTTILPDDPDLALRLFRELVDNQPYFLFVALGAGAEAETAVQRADNLSGREEDLRWVVWARKPRLIEKKVEALANGDLLSGKLNSARAFTLSQGDEVRDVIEGGEPVPDLARILEAFANAERE